TLMNWQITLLPLDEEFIRKRPSATINSKNKPCNFFSGNFDLSETGDTYFDMSAYTKGVLFINGHNLGRYWNIGPQQRLYCPASWLKNGKNEVLVFDLHQLKAIPVRSFTIPD